MEILVENKTNKTTSYKEFKTIPEKGDFIDNYKVIYSGYGDVIDDGEGQTYREWIVIIEKLNILELILKKLKFFDYF